jgi:GT2 family glycosyltransferase
MEDGPFNFSKTVNLGISQSSSTYNLLLNDDIYFDGFINLEKALNIIENRDIGIIGFMTLYPNLRIQQFGASVYNGIIHETWKGTFYNDLKPIQILPHEVTAVSGAAIMFDQQKLKSVGGFDESFPLEYNDIELSLRMKKYGFRNIVMNIGRIVHLESQTREHKHNSKDFERLLLKHGPFGQRDEFLFTP